MKIKFGFGFFLLVGYFIIMSSLYSGLVYGFNAFTLINGILVTGIIYSTLIFHEAAHLIAARYWGVEVKSLNLLWYGVGLELGDRGLNTETKFLTTFFGPYINLLIAFVLIIVTTFIKSDLLNIAIFFNLLLGVSSYIPIKPFDGWILLTCGYKLLRDKINGKFGAGV
jgi:membrane-associated protease RseP (regulator of RpoE activity)